MRVSIKAGDLNNMTEFDMSILNGLMAVCSKVSISHMGIHIWLDSKHISILGNVIRFEFLGRKFLFDEIVINHEALNGISVIDFTIRFNDSELYLSVVLDV